MAKIQVTVSVTPPDSFDGRGATIVTCTKCSRSVTAHGYEKKSEGWAMRELRETCDEDNYYTTDPVDVEDTIEPANAIQLIPYDQLSIGQKDAINYARQQLLLASGPAEMAISGPAGTGKTTLVNHLIDQIRAARYRPVLTAMTHQAAGVLSDKAGMGARTTASAFGLKVEENHTSGRTELKASGSPKVRKGDVVIVDEASMVSTSMLARLREVMANTGCKIVYIGDAYQLPPVDDSDGVPDLEGIPPVFTMVALGRQLTEVMRQQGDNPILDLANGFRVAIEGGVEPILSSYAKAVARDGQSDEGIFIGSREEATRWAINDINERGFAPDRAKTLAFTNARCDANAQPIRLALFGDRANTERYIVGEQVTLLEPLMGDRGKEVVLRQGQTVTVVDVEYDTHHGVNCYVVTIRHGKTVTGVAVSMDHTVYVPVDPGAHKRQLNSIAAQAQAKRHEADMQAPTAMSSNDFGPTKLQELEQEAKDLWKEYYITKKAFHELRSVYVSTIHKSQGSTYEICFVDVHDIMAAHGLSRKLTYRLLYVACTRPSHRLVLFGDLARWPFVQ